MTIPLPFGRKRRFIIDYNVGSSTYSLDIFAESWEEAENHLDGLKQTGRVEGELFNSVPAWAVSIGLLRPWCWVQDFWRGR